MNHKLMFLLVTSFLIISCVSKPDLTKRPEWIDQTQSLYPSNQYLTAVGEGTTRNRARKNAQVNLVEIFSINVKAQTNVITNATKSDSALGVSAESSTSLNRTIETETSAAVSGLDIKQTWLSPKGKYYALAVLEKQKLANSLRKTIDQLDTSSAQDIDFSIHHAPNEIASINALRTARDKQIARHLANIQLREVSLGDIPKEISISKIEGLINKKIAGLSVSVSAKNNQNKETVESGLAAMGVHVTENGKLKVIAKIDLSSPVLINQWYWLRGSYQLSITQGGKVISRKRWSIKVSSKDESLLNLRLNDNLSKKISTYLIELMSDSLTS
ncbi:MAG: LPP20 family lipoprotein [Psychromonas sp.]|nr:LPP20 family lipoprotein [Psychromonas sp.]